MNFLPTDYQGVPQSGGKYMKFKQGANKFRILSSAIVGYEYWTNENKPVRMHNFPQTPPGDMRQDSKIKHFWAFVVWNYNEQEVQILEVTQTSIMNTIKALVDDPDWGDPKQFDITVSRTGEKLETEYTVTSSPPKELPMEAANAYAAEDINLEALFDGADPFAKDPQVDTDSIKV